MSPLMHSAMVLAAVIFNVACYATPSNGTSKPNIIVILVDDQDLHLNSLDHMAIVQQELVQKGTFFQKHYGHVSQCCPARTTIWTGKHAHNTNITSVWNTTPGGAWKHVQQFGWYKKYLPVWMQAAGYDTYYSGKIFNGYKEDNYCEPHCLEGWSHADVLVDPTTYAYYNSTWSHFNGERWHLNKRVVGYNTDQIGENVANFIGEAVNSDKPFFAVAAPVAPHTPTIPKAEYAHLFPDLKIPRSPNFNPDNRSGVAAVWSLEQLDEANIAALDEFYRRRQQCLQSVDDMVGTIIQKLNETGVLENTFIIYSTDNGYHIGNHRLQGGKDQCFEEDINIPFIIRGPQVGQGQMSNLTTGHIDIAPTILTLAGVDVNDGWDLDGTPITFPFESETDYLRNLHTRTESTHLEMWGPFLQEWNRGDIGVDVDRNLQIYKALRLQGNGYNLMYSVWCQDSAHELYDMSWDPYQMTNLHPQAPADDLQINAYHRGMHTYLGRPTWNVIHRLDALVLVQKTCVGDVCRNPWKQLHPNGTVQTLADALDERYDGFYANSYRVAKVGWEKCYTGLNMTSSSTLYTLQNEHPLWLNETIVHLVRSGSRRELVCGSVPAWSFVLLALHVIVSYAF